MNTYNKRNRMVRTGRPATVLTVAAVILFMTACTHGGFTKEEQNRILEVGKETEVMHIFTNLDPQELDFLHQLSTPLSRQAVRSSAYAVLKERMLATVRDSATAGVGIAAPQVGIGKQLIAVQRFDKEGRPFEFYINPTIEYYSPEQKWGWEGCLSVPGERDTVLRSTQIVVSYRESDTWELVRDTVEGYTAVIFQHEIDHLNGKLYID